MVTYGIGKVGQGIAEGTKNAVSIILERRKQDREARQSALERQGKTAEIGTESDGKFNLITPSQEADFISRGEDSGLSLKTRYKAKAYINTNPDPKDPNYRKIVESRDTLGGDWVPIDMATTGIFRTTIAGEEARKTEEMKGGIQEKQISQKGEEERKNIDLEYGWKQKLQKQQEQASIEIKNMALKDEKLKNLIDLSGKLNASKEEAAKNGKQEDYDKAREQYDNTIDTIKRYYDSKVSEGQRFKKFEDFEKVIKDYYIMGINVWKETESSRKEVPTAGVNGDINTSATSNLPPGYTEADVEYNMKTYNKKRPEVIDQMLKNPR